MPFPPAPPLRLRKGDREHLEAMVRKRTLAQRLVFRARILLYCADGLPHRQIKRQLHTSVDAVVRWRGRYEQEGLDGFAGPTPIGQTADFFPLSNSIVWSRWPRRCPKSKAIRSPNGV